MKIIHFADLHLGVETYGHINPESGLSSRLEDYLKALDEVVDYALENKIDLVLFSGDAYKTREPSQTQQREFAKRIRRLSEGGVPLFMVIGNHDLPNALGRATAIEIFDTLPIPNVYVSSRPEICKIKTPGGEIQIATLPWVRRSALLSREDTRNLDFNQINERLQQILTGIIADHASKLDPSLPAILAAHVWVMNARVGSEKSMSIGQEHMLLLGSVGNPAFDYVALGHIHKGQVLQENPPVIYSGSLERLDFGDEEDPKGFYVIEIAGQDSKSDQFTPDSLISPLGKDPSLVMLEATRVAEASQGGEAISISGKSRCPRRTTYRFQPVKSRRFYTLSIDIEPEDLDPTFTVLRAVETNRDRIKDAIVRIDISLPAALSNKMRDNEIRAGAREAYYLTITRQVRRETRLRLGKGALEGITPQEALKAYLEAKYPADRAQALLEYGEKLIQDHTRKG